MSRVTLDKLISFPIFCEVGIKWHVLLKVYHELKYAKRLELYISYLLL